MKLNELTEVHKGRTIRLPGKTAMLEGVLTDFRSEEIRHDKSSYGGAGTQYTIETYVTVCLDGKWLSEQKGRLVTVEVVD